MRKVNYWKTLLLVLCTGCIFAACSDDDDENPFTGVDNNFLSFSLESNENVWKATIIDNEITVTVPEGTSLDGAQASYTLSEQATVNPNPSSVTAWGEEQQFTVTSYNGTTRTYKYTVRYSAVSEIGTFILNSQADVDAFADHHVTVIEGSLSIATVENTEDPVINLNGLAKITEVMDDITIGQYYKGENLAGLAKLEKVGSISMRNNSSLTEFALPNLLSIRGELIIENPAENKITSIKCPQLTTILKQCKIQAPNLKSLNLNSLESIPGKGDNSDGDGTFSLYGSQLVSLDLPALKQVEKEFTLPSGTKHPELTQINLPELTSCKDVSIGSADKLETISLPKLSNRSSFSITSCAKFSKLNETIAPSNLEKLSVSHCPSITELDASQKDINSISITYVDNNFVLKGKEVTLEEMDDNPEIDSWVMKDTTISELVEDEKQKLLYVFDYITERCFFIELSEIITGKDMNGAKCTKKSGDAPKQTVDFEEMAAASGSLDLDENFYGDQDFDMEDFDQEGFDIGGDASTPYEEEKF